MTRDALPANAATVGGRRATGAGTSRGRAAGPAFSVAFRDEARALAAHNGTPPVLADLALALADAPGTDTTPALHRACAPLSAPAAAWALPDLPAAVATLLAAAYAEAGSRPAAKAVLAAVRKLPPPFQAAFGSAAAAGIAARLAAVARGLAFSGGDGDGDGAPATPPDPARAEAALARAGEDVLALLAAPTPGRGAAGGGGGGGGGPAGLAAALDGPAAAAVLAPLADALTCLADRPGAGAGWGIPLDAVAAAAALVPRVASAAAAAAAAAEAAAAAATAPPLTPTGAPPARAALAAAVDAFVSILAVRGLHPVAYGAAGSGAAAALTALRPPGEGAAAAVAGELVTGLLLSGSGGGGAASAPLTDTDADSLPARLAAVPLPAALAAAKGLAGSLPAPALTAPWSPPDPAGDGGPPPSPRAVNERPPCLLIDGLILPAVAAASGGGGGGSDRGTAAAPPGALPLLAAALTRLAKEAGSAAAGLHTALANAEGAGLTTRSKKAKAMRRTPSVLTFSEEGAAAAAAACGGAGGVDDGHAAALAAGLADGLPLGGDLYESSSSDGEGDAAGLAKAGPAGGLSEGGGGGLSGLAAELAADVAGVDAAPTLTLPRPLQAAITGALLPRLASSEQRDARDAQAALDAALDALEACARRDRLAAAWGALQAAARDEAAAAATPPPTPPPLAHAGSGFASTLDALTAQVLAMEPWRKGRYPPLRALARRGGAAHLLAQAGPGLMAEVIGAMRDGSAASSAGAAFAELVQGLVASAAEEEEEGVGGGVGGVCGDDCVPAPGAAGRSLWLPPVVSALTSPDEAWRAGVAAHALPAAVEADPACVAPLLAAIDVAAGAGGCGPDGRAAALVAVLSAARRAGLLPGLAPRPGDPPLSLPLGALVDAARAADPALRERALALAADDGSAARLPGAAELATAAAALDAAFRAGDDGSRRAAARLGGRLLRRIHAAACAAVTARAARAAGVTAASSPDEDAAEAAALAAAAAFQRWLTAAAVAGLHPGAHYARRFMGSRLIAEVGQVWCGVGKAARAWRSLPPLGPGTLRAGGVVVLPPGSDGAGPVRLPFFCPGFFTGATVAALLNCLADPWDRLRGAAADALAALPPPLPGLGTGAALGRALAWAADLVASPRAREADAGARLLTLAHSLYVRRLGWAITVSGEGWEPSVVEVAGGEAPPPPPPALARGLALLDSLTARAEADLAAAASDPDAAARRGYACAALRCARALVADLDWGAATAAGGGGSGSTAGPAAPAALAPLAASSLARLLAAAHGALALTEDVLAAPHAEFAGAEDVAEGGEGLAFGGGGGGGQEPAAAASAGGRSLLRLSAAWRTMTEGLAVFETVVVAVPPPELEEVGGGRGKDRAARPPPLPPLLPPPALVDMGAALARVLVRVKHVGALDTARSALAALAARLLADTSPGSAAPSPAFSKKDASSTARPLRAWPDAWRADWTAAATAPGAGLDDLVRRSGGLPFYAVALMQAGAAAGAASAAGAGLVRSCLADVMRLVGWRDGAGSGGGTDADAVDSYAPVVHGFNTLRAAIDDGSLADATAGVRTAGLAAALRGLQARQWPVRNAASLALAALLRRTVGGPPPPDGDAPPPRSALTAADLFHRLPGLQAVLEAELAAVGGGSGGGVDEGARPLHAVLALLGRLRPGAAAGMDGQGAGEADPLGTLRRAVHRCAGSRVANLRALAAAALPPLVPGAGAGSGAGAEAALAWAAGLATAPGGLPTGPTIPDHNTVAGRLAQLRAVLVAARWPLERDGGGGDGVAATPELAAAADAACGAVLSHVAWLMAAPADAPASAACPAVRAEALAVAGAALDAAAVARPPRGAPPLPSAAALNAAVIAASRAALAEAAARAAAAAAAAAMPAGPPVEAALPPPGEALLLTEAAAALTASGRRGGGSGAAAAVAAAPGGGAPWPPEDDARAAVGAPDPAARTAALEGLAACLPAAAAAAAAADAPPAHLLFGPPPWVRALALSAAAGEARPEPLAAALALLAALPPPSDPAAGGEAVRRAAAALLVWPACPPVKAAAVRAAGRGIAPIVAASLADGGSVSPAARAALAAFGAAVDAAAAPTEDESERGAAAAALADSGLLPCLGGGGEAATTDLAPAAARAWLAAITLLQDEDAGVRAAAAAAVTAGGAWPAAPAVGAADAAGGEAAAAAATADAAATAAAGPTAPAATPDAPVLLCAATRLLAVRAGRVAAVRAALLAAVFEPTPAAALAAAAGGAPGARGAAAGAAAAAALRLYDPEPVNTAAEPALLAHAAAGAIIAGGTADPAAWAAELGPWAGAAAADLAALVALPDAGEGWPAGALHRPAACLAALRSAAALTAAARVLLADGGGGGGSAVSSAAPSAPGSPRGSGRPATPPAPPAVTPPPAAVVATVRDVLTAALIVFGLTPDPDALGPAPPCVTAAVAAAAAAWGVGTTGDGGGGGGSVDAAAAPASPPCTPLAAAGEAVLLEDALFLVRPVPGQEAVVAAAAAAT